MEYCSIEKNAKDEINDPVLEHTFGNKTVHKISLPSQMRIKNTDLNLEKYSNMYPRNLDSFARWNVFYEEPEHEDNVCFLQKNTIATVENSRVQISTPYLSLKNGSNFNAAD
ncbi:hypothetical protein TNIN_113321 [Trichonephila inaurata madagascariensis]|uniref:Uncharacterized protein n=1 Tax=Trichonephila inaurata madagascariensis TaxID=2747483 RepID=A0A8X6MIL7_9ARAC|nr:hypothetical protein TNIN_113321 [Trichonephila inaurata madagascariensis]